MALLCGIDLGSFTTDSYVAWLEDGHFLLETYRPTLGLPPVVDEAERVIREGFIVAPAQRDSL